MISIYSWMYFVGVCCFSIVCTLTLFKCMELYTARKVRLLEEKLQVTRRLDRIEREVVKSTREILKLKESSND